MDEFTRLETSSAILFEGCDRPGPDRNQFITWTHIEDCPQRPQRHAPDAQCNCDRGVFTRASFDFSIVLSTLH